MFGWIDGFRVTLEFMFAADTCPDVFVVNVVCVFRSDVHVAVAEGPRDLFGPVKDCLVMNAHHLPDFVPFLEFSSMGAVPHIADHEIREVAELMSDYIDKAIWHEQVSTFVVITSLACITFIINDLFCQFDARLMSVTHRGHSILLNFYALFLPVCSSSGRVQGLAPN